MHLVTPGANTLLSGYSKLGDVRNAKAVLEMLMERGFMPDIVTFTSLIDGLCHAHQLDDAFGCFKEMAGWGVRPNARTYNVLMRALCSAGHVNKAIDLINRMKIDGIAPDAYSFNAPILSLCRMQKVDKARNVFNAMLRLGVLPDSHTCTTLIKALCDGRRVDGAKEILLATNHHSYWPIVSALTKMGRFSEAGQLMNKYHIRNVQLGRGSNRTTEPDIDVRVVNV